jgi:hypothetical protein
MPTTDTPLTSLTSFDAIVERLEHLTTAHALAHRLQVGQVLLDAFYDGDLHAYQSRAPDKAVRLEEFLRERQEVLAQLGLSGRLLRQCVRAYAVWRTLPPLARAGLRLGQLALLTRLADPSARAAVAVAALRHGWTQRQLTDAVDTVRGGGALDEGTIASIEDSGGVAAGGEAAAAPAPAPKGSRQPGRLVSEAERWSQAVQGWQERWATVDAEKLRPAQRRRVLEAAVRLERQVVALRQRLEALTR